MRPTACEHLRFRLMLLINDVIQHVVHYFTLDVVDSVPVRHGLQQPAVTSQGKMSTRF